MERLSVDYGKKCKLEFAIYPAPQVCLNQRVNSSVCADRCQRRWSNRTTASSPHTRRSNTATVRSWSTTRRSMIYVDVIWILNGNAVIYVRIRTTVVDRHTRISIVSCHKSCLASPPRYGSTVHSTSTCTSFKQISCPIHAYISHSLPMHRSYQREWKRRRTPIVPLQ
jgi:hypothetical protein